MLSIAHRGIHDTATENTLDAFQRAMDLGFDAVELDVRMTADRACVVHHDEAVVTAQALLPIRDTTLATLQAAVPEIPSLDSVLDLLARKAHVYVEIKDSGAELELAAVLARSPASVSVHSFDHRVVLRMRHTMPQLRTGILQTSRLTDSAGALRAAGATDFWQWHDFIDRALVEEVTAAGGRVIAWTTNSPPEWRIFADIGVAGICTDSANFPTFVSARSSPNRGLILDAID